MQADTHQNLNRNMQRIQYAIKYFYPRFVQHFETGLLLNQTLLTLLGSRTSKKVVGKYHCYSERLKKYTDK